MCLWRSGEYLLLSDIALRIKGTEFKVEREQKRERKTKAAIQFDSVSKRKQVAKYGLLYTYYHNSYTNPGNIKISVKVNGRRNSSSNGSSSSHNNNNNKNNLVGVSIHHTDTLSNRFSMGDF